MCGYDSDVDAVCNFIDNVWESGNCKKPFLILSYGCTIGWKSYETTYQTRGSKAVLRYRNGTRDRWLGHPYVILLHSCIFPVAKYRNVIKSFCTEDNPWFLLVLLETRSRIRKINKHDTIIVQTKTFNQFRIAIHLQTVLPFLEISLLNYIYDHDHSIEIGSKSYFVQMNILTE